MVVYGESCSTGRDQIGAEELMFHRRYKANNVWGRILHIRDQVKRNHPIISPLKCSLYKGAASYLWGINIERPSPCTIISFRKCGIRIVKDMVNPRGGMTPRPVGTGRDLPQRLGRL